MSCGDDGGGGGNDDELAAIGFATPTVATVAYAELEEGRWTKQGPANWSCLNTASDEVPTLADIELSGTLLDFQDNEPLPGAIVTLYGDEGISSSPIGSATADADGKYTLTLPSGGTNWAFKLEVAEALDTYPLNRYFDPNSTSQTEDLDSVSVLTAQALPAFIGVTRTPGLGIVAGRVHDCDGNRVEGTIATVSDTPDLPSHIEGAVSYYFSALSTSLPVRHSVQNVTNTDGVFVSIELPPGQERYLQVWGFVDDADLADGEMTLLAQESTPIIADAVVTVSLRPLRQ